MLTYILFVAGFVILVKGADLLVDGASSIAKKLKVSALVIGLTIVSFGTSAPELVINIMASARGNTDIAIGNILGSNIANILLILGISALIYPIAAQKNTVWKEIPLSLLAAILVGVMANDIRLDHGLFSGLTRIDGIVLLSFFIIFIYYTFGISKVTGSGDSPNQDNPHSVLKSSLFVLTGLAGLAIGGQWIVTGAVKIAELFHISQSLIGLTVVAIGTSLPELATTAVAAYKKQADIAIGNVVGSNIFNLFFVLGISSLIRPLPFNPSSDLDIIMTIIASLILFSIMFIGKKHTIERWQGLLMIILYAGYVAWLIYQR